VDWSHDLLSEPERVLLRRLSVFAGGWTLEAAEAVCAFGAGDGSCDDVLELLSELVAKSLVVADEQDGQMRYRFLETIRQYGAERLRRSGEEPAVRGRHLEWFLALAEQGRAGAAGARPGPLARPIGGGARQPEDGPGVDPARIVVGTGARRWFAPGGRLVVVLAGTQLFQ